MQPVPALGRERIAAQLAIAGYAPHVAGDAEAVGEKILRPQRFAQERPAAEKLRPWRDVRRLTTANEIQTAPDTLLGALGRGRVRVRLVIQRQVIEYRFAVVKHA